MNERAQVSRVGPQLLRAAQRGGYVVAINLAIVPGEKTGSEGCLHKMVPICVLGTLLRTEQ